jgi:serine/threonine protein kinase
MDASLIREKGLFEPLRRELQILYRVQGLPGCIQLVDVLADRESLGLVTRYYPAGDLARYIRIVRPKTRTLPENVAKLLFIQLLKTF